MLPEPEEEILHDLFGLVAGFQVGIRECAQRCHVRTEDHLEAALIAREKLLEPLVLDSLAVVDGAPRPRRGHSFARLNIPGRNIIRAANASAAKPSIACGEKRVRPYPVTATW